MAKHGHQHHPGETPDVSHIKNPDVTHELSDVPVKPIAWFIVGLFVSGVVIMVVIYGMYQYFERREQRAEEKPASLVAPDSPPLPPEPRLQGIPGFSNHPLEDMKALRAKEDERLDHYGWVDQTSGTVHIPIKEAMKLVAERGLSAKPPGGAPAPTGTPRQPGAKEQALPADSSSGRTPERSEPK